MNPCYSGFQVQGTATTPAGMVPSEMRNLLKKLTLSLGHIRYYNKFFPKMQYFYKI